MSGTTDRLLLGNRRSRHVPETTARIGASELEDQFLVPGQRPRRINLVGPMGADIDRSRFDLVGADVVSGYLGLRDETALLRGFGIQRPMTAAQVAERRGERS